MPRHIVSLMPRYVLCGLILSAGLLDLAGCGSYNAPSQLPATPTSVTISPTSASVPASSGTQNFTATVMNDYQRSHLGPVRRRMQRSRLRFALQHDLKCGHLQCTHLRSQPCYRHTHCDFGQRHLEKFHCHDHRYGGRSPRSRGSVSHDNGHPTTGRHAAIV